jgi:hypothetical protein
MGLAFTKVVLAGTLLTGGITMGAMTTYNGGSAITAAKDKITQQGVQLGIFKSQSARMVAKIQTQKDRLAYLEANGTEKDQAEIADLKAQIASYETNAEAGGEQMAQRVLDLQAEVDKANTDATALQTTVDGAKVETAMTESQMDKLLDEVPAGYALLKMLADTPQTVMGADGNATKLVIDKNIINGDTANAKLVVNNNGVANYTVTLEGQQPKTIVGGESYDFGLVKDLDGLTLTVKDAYAMEIGKYYLTAE